MDLLPFFLTAIVAAPIVVTLVFLRKNSGKGLQHRIFLGISVLFSLFSLFFLFTLFIETIGDCGASSGSPIRCNAIPELTTLANILSFGSSWASLVYAYYWVIGLFIYLITALGLFGGVVLRTCAAILLCTLVLGAFFVFFFKGSTSAQEGRDIISVPAGTF